MSAAAALAVALPAPLLDAADEAGKFGLAVLRRDGNLVPFASYDGHDWRADWPGSDLGVNLPISTRDIPKKWWGAPGPDAPWTAYLLDGKSQPLALRKPQDLRVFCGGRPAVLTDYPPGDFDPREPSVPKDGLAIAGDATLEPIPRVSNLSADAAKLVEAITDAFNTQETLAATHFVNWVHPFPEARRKTFPVELEAFYRRPETTPSGTWSVSYVEAVRRYPARPGDDGCGLITFARGWVLEQDGKEPVIDIGARVTYCDRAEVTFMLPFGQLTIDREPYWVFQLSSWRDEMYAVARITPQQVRTVLAVIGGSCPNTPPRGRGRGGD